MMMSPASKPENMENILNGHPISSASKARHMTATPRCTVSSTTAIIKLYNRI